MKTSQQSEFNQKCKAELTSLPPELLELIVQYLPQQSLSRLTQSHSILRAIVLPGLYRHPYLETMAKLEKFLEAIQTQFQDQPIGRFVEVVSVTLEVGDSLEDSNPINEQFEPLEVAHRWNYVTSEFLYCLATNCPNLKEVILDECSQIGDTFLVDLSQHCQKLEKLDLKRCFKITDKGLMAIAENCPSLEYLGIWDLTNITDAPLITLAQKAKGLVMLDLKGTLITGACLEVLIEHHAKTLEMIDITGCFDIGPIDDLIRFKKPPQLEIIQHNSEYDDSGDTDLSEDIDDEPFDWVLHPDIRGEGLRMLIQEGLESAGQDPESDVELWSDEEPW
jgi:hypothetical protein